MRLNFIVEPIKFNTLEELPNAWQVTDFKSLLDIMEYGDTGGLSSEELKDMCLLSLSDLDPPEAAKIVLRYVFKERLNPGQIENIAHEMLEEKMWEEYAELSMHEEFFNVAQLLYNAYNGKFPHPQAVRFRVEITAKEKTGVSHLTKEREVALIRILAKGMPGNTLINRLFEDQMESGEFPDAKYIIWQYNIPESEGNSKTFEIVSSEYWFRDFKYAETYETGLIVDDL